MTTDIRLLYATAPDAATAAEIARALLDERVCACVNILGEIRSLYRWRGAIEDATEVAFIIKTTRASASDARKIIAARHPYDTPAIVDISVDGGAPDFLRWIAKETRPGTDDLQHDHRHDYSLTRFQQIARISC